MSTHSRTRCPSLVLVLILGCLLCSCSAVRIRVIFDNNQSGTISLAFGMTPESQRLATCQGVDPFEIFRQRMVEENGGQYIPVARYQSEGYEWVEGQVQFNDLNELKDRLMETGLFSSLSVTSSSALFIETMIFQAEIQPVWDDGQVPESISHSILTSSIPIQLAIQLPGEVTESNGFTDETLETLIWEGNGDLPVDVAAESRTVLWDKILLAAGFSLLACVCLVFAIRANRI